jgi:hypothetical protein
MDSEMTVDLKEVAPVMPAMSPAETARRQRVRFVQWAAAILVAVLVHGAALFLIDLPEDRDPAGQRRAAPVSFRTVDPEDGGRLLREQLEFSDTAPLYFPTGWNVANAENLRVPLKSPGDIFEPYKPRLGFSRVEAHRLVALPKAEITAPTAALAGFQPDATRLAGRIDRVETIPDERIALVEVFDMRDGGKVFETTVQEVVDGSALATVDWKPAEWVILMDSVGLVGKGMMTRSSGSDTVDDELQSLVDNELDLDKQIIPGYYMVILGP